ncbi:MAG: histidine kinase dimerization/phosphoacceptor domain -containing protein [Bacteroidota bacterium]
MFGLTERNSEDHHDIDDIDDVVSHYKGYSESLEQINELANYICGTTISLINVIGEQYQIIISSAGEIDRDIVPIAESLCRYTIAKDEMLIIKDTREDFRSKAMPSVVEDKIGFYASVPIPNPNGDSFSTLCVMDREPNKLSKAQVDALNTLGNQLELITALYYKDREYHSLLNSYDRLETLFAEIHHRLKNNLADIIGLIQIQAAQLPDNEARRILHKTEQRISIAAKIHEILYESETDSEVFIKRYVERLVGSIFDSIVEDESFLTFRLDIEPFQLDINRTLALGIIINELVTNAIEHAFEERGMGEIEIILNQSEDMGHLTISDNGKGMIVDEDSLYDTGNLGMKLIHLLARQLKAVFSFEGKKGDGLTFTMDFPIKPIGSNNRQTRNSATHHIS